MGAGRGKSSQCAFLLVTCFCVLIGFVTQSTASARNLGALLRLPILSRILRAESSALHYGVDMSLTGETILRDAGKYGALESDLTELGARVARQRGMRIVKGEKIDFDAMLLPEEEQLIDAWLKSKVGHVPQDAVVISAPKVEVKLPGKKETPAYSDAPPIAVSTGTIEQKLALNARENFGAQIKDYWNGMATCLRNAPPSQQADSRMRQFLVSMGSSEVITVGLYFATTEKENQRFLDLGMDIFMQVLRYGMRSARMRPDQSFSGMYWNMLFVNGAMNTLDAGIYTAMASGLGQSEEEISSANSRHAYNQLWSAGVSDWLGPSLFRVSQGLKCLHPGARFLSAGTTAAYFSIDTGVTAVYYLGRQKFQNSY